MLIFKSKVSSPLSVIACTYAYVYGYILLNINYSLCNVACINDFRTEDLISKSQLACFSLKKTVMISVLIYPEFFV